MIRDEDRLLRHIERWRKNPAQFVRDTLPAVPDNIQTDVLRRLAPEHALVTVESAHGVGKFHGYSLEIDTPVGKRLWGQVQVGDMLWGADGAPVAVTHRHEQGVQEIYRVTFSDGTETFAGADHLWTVQRDKRVTIPTRDLLTTRTRLPIPCPVRYQKSDLAVHPYLLGAWLGDGSKSRGVITSADAPMWEEIQRLGYELGPLGKKGMSRTVYGLQAQLRAEGLLDVPTAALTIPIKYKYGSVDQRLSLLQGLLDTDGWVETSGSVRFGSVSRALTEDVAWLARSLGLMARAVHVRASGYKTPNGGYSQCRAFYRVLIAWDGVSRLFRLDRKQSKLRLTAERYRSKWVTGVTYSHTEPSMCVTVGSPDGLYLVNDFIVTHNSTVASWAALWNLGCFRASKTPITAVTKEQLASVMWAELSGWFDQWELQEAFLKTKTAVAHKEYGEYWWIRQKTWSKDRLDAMMGIHSKSNLFIFDEASGIPAEVYQHAEGSLFKRYSRALMIGNPLHNYGYFYEANHPPTPTRIWDHMSVSCFDSEISTKNDPDYPIRMAEKYGKDSNTYRIRVLGLPPRTEDDAVVDSALVIKASQREITEAPAAEPVVIGVDPARFGSNPSGIVVRHGTNVLFVRECLHFDTMQLASEVDELAHSLYPEAMINIDTIGIGSGVADRLRQIASERSRRYSVNDVSVAEVAEDKVRFARKRDELWWRVREWFRDEAPSITDDQDLIAEISAPKYKFNTVGKIVVESKDDMQKRGIESPNLADALCLTFANTCQANIRLI